MRKKPRIGGDEPSKYKPRRTKKCGSGNNVYSLLLLLFHRCSNSYALLLNLTLPFFFIVSSFSLLLSASSIIECISTGLSCLSTVLCSSTRTVLVPLSTPFLPIFISHLRSALTLVPSVTFRQHQFLNLKCG